MLSTFLCAGACKEISYDATYVHAASRGEWLFPSRLYRDECLCFPVILEKAACFERISFGGGRLLAI